MKIMIVDDSAEMRRLLKSLLDERDVEFVECSDGGEAIEQFASTRPDWTVMDLRMTPVGGLAATRAIKASFPSSRILMISQESGARWKAAARDAGATEFYSKDDLTLLRHAIFSSEQNP